MPRKFTTSAVDAGTPLGAWVARRLGLRIEDGEALVAGGSVYVSGRRVRDPARPVAAGERIVVHEAASRESARVRPVGPFTVRPEDIPVVFRGQGALVVDKPSGLPTQATREAAGGLDELVARRFPGAVPLHRLDRDASGLVLFAEGRAARARLADDLRSGRIERVYLALVAGHPAADRFTLDMPIGRDPGDPRRRRVHGAGAEPARTHVKVLRRGRLADGAPAAALSVTLETGRTHQIRVHLAAAGHPLLGDPLYAPPDVARRAPRLALHATRLSWPGGAAESPPPEELTRLIAAPSG